MANFQKSNWTRTASGEHARQYFPGGIGAQTITAATTAVITLTATYQFQGNGQVEASLPVTATLAAGLVLGQAQLIGPASGSYALGNHPRITVQVSNPTAANITPTACDLVVVQY
jgi:hypothetical protein